MSSVEEIMKVVRKAHGDESIITYEDGVRKDVDVISTGSIRIDEAVGVGGLPRGRIVEVYGPESSGKTTLCLEVIANAQKDGDTVAFVDTEHALDIIYAEQIGVQITGDNPLMLSQPDCGEDALNIVETLIQTSNIGVVVVDSVAALTPRAEIQGEMGDVHVGLQARLMSQALRKLTALVKRNNTLLIFTNQIRKKIGVSFGSPNTTSGGEALKFYASIRIEIRRIGTEKDKDKNATANKTLVKIVKNKVAPPFKQTELFIKYGVGFDIYSEVLDLGLEYGLIEKKGSWYSYDETMLGQGREAVAVYLKEDVEFFQGLLDYLKTLIKGGETNEEAEDEKEEKPKNKKRKKRKKRKRRSKRRKTIKTKTEDEEE